VTTPIVLQAVSRTVLLDLRSRITAPATEPDQRLASGRRERYARAHIEQGRCWNARKTICVVTGSRLGAGSNIEVSGKTDHAGTTPPRCAGRGARRHRHHQRR